MRALTNIIIVIVLITPIVHPKQYAIAFCECCAAKKKAQRSLTKQKQIRAKQINHIKSKRSSNAQQKHSTAKQSEAGW